MKTDHKNGPRLDGAGKEAQLSTQPARELPKNGSSQGPALITGGSGFIGTNLADRLLNSGKRVVLYDNLSRSGVENNYAWLRERHGSRVSLIKSDVRDFEALRQAVRHASQVYHFAAQVAVTTSLDAPFEDFEINARGTLNLLEALRELPEPPPMLYTSTNKVYGDLSDVSLRMNGGRYEPEDADARAHGFSESRHLHFHSPYGCSKGAACQYVLDYARTFGLNTVVFRMSCIYGPHQFGTEDQGWVAHFLIQALENSPISIYGDGRQVRDILYVEDLVDAFLLAQQHIRKLRGQVFNIGGGPKHTTSLLELMDLIGKLHGKTPDVRFADWRPADQQYYVSDIRKFSQATGWRPRTDVRAGVQNLYRWLSEFRATQQRTLVPLPPPRRRNGKLRVRTPRARGVHAAKAVRLKPAARNGHGRITNIRKNAVPRILTKTT